MVVRQRTGQQVLAHDRRTLYPYLGTAHVLLVLATRHLHIHCQQPFHILAQLNQCVIARLHFTVDGYAYARLEMSRVLMFLRHRQSYRTFSQQDLTVRLNTFRRTHPCGLAGQTLASHHRQQYRDIRLATGRNTFVLQLADCYATRVLYCREQVETTDRDAVQLIFGYDLFQTLIDGLGAFHARIYLTKRRKLLKRNVYQFAVHRRLNGLVIHAGCNKPFGCLAYDTQTHLFIALEHLL